MNHKILFQIRGNFILKGSLETRIQLETRLKSKSGKAIEYQRRCQKSRQGKNQQIRLTIGREYQNKCHSLGRGKPSKCHSTGAEITKGTLIIGGKKSKKCRTF